MTFLGRSRFRDRLRSVGGEAFPLDGITTPTMAISTARRLTSSYTGNLLNVINAGGTPADIGYTGSNVLNTTALLAHTGTGGADTGRIVRVYGQVGTIDGYQGTATNSPWIVQAGSINTIGTRPGCKPQTAGEGVNTVTTGGTTSANLHGAQDDFTFLCVLINPTSANVRDFYRQSGTGLEAYLAEANAGGGRGRIDPAGTAIIGADNSNQPGSNPRILAGRRTSGSCVLWRNPSMTSIATGTAATQFLANAYTIFSSATDRVYAEFYWWNSSISTGEVTALMADCATFYSAGFP